MPTLHGRSMPLSPGSPSALMGDLSLADDSFALPDRPAHASASASGNPNAFAGSQPPTASHSRIIDGSSRGHSISQAPATGTGTEPGNARTKPRFSLFAPQSGGSAVSTGHAQRELDDLEDHPEDPGRGEERHFGSEEGEGIEAAEGETIHSSKPAQSSEEREDRLRESLYELRQMNEVFDGFLSALLAARGHNEVSGVESGGLGIASAVGNGTATETGAGQWVSNGHWAMARHGRARTGTGAWTARPRTAPGSALTPRRGSPRESTRLPLCWISTPPCWARRNIPGSCCRIRRGQAQTM